MYIPSTSMPLYIGADPFVSAALTRAGSCQLSPPPRAPHRACARPPAIRCKTLGRWGWAAAPGQREARSDTCNDTPGGPVRRCVCCAELPGMYGMVKAEAVVRANNYRQGAERGYRYIFVLRSNMCAGFRTRLHTEPRQRPRARRASHSRAMGGTHALVLGTGPPFSSHSSPSPAP
jgi:hypothetical protein